MPGGPGKGRSQDPFRRQTMQPEPFGQVGNNPPPPPPQLEMVGNNPVGRPMPQPFFGNPASPQPDQSIGRPMPYQPSFGQPMAQPAYNQPMPQPLSGVTGGSFGQMGPTNPMQFPQPEPPASGFERVYRNNLPRPNFSPLNPLSGGFYGGGITDLYPR